MSCVFSAVRLFCYSASAMLCDCCQYYPAPCCVYVYNNFCMSFWFYCVIGGSSYRPAEFTSNQVSMHALPELQRIAGWSRKRLVIFAYLIRLPIPYATVVLFWHTTTLSFSLQISVGCHSQLVWYDYTYSVLLLCSNRKWMYHSRGFLQLTPSFPWYVRDT